MPKFVFLWTDIFLWLVIAMAAIYVSRVARNPNARRTWRRVFVAPTPMSASIVVGVFIVVAMLDSIHFRPRIDATPTPGAKPAPAVYSGETLSLLDAMLAPLRESREKTYSRAARVSLVLEGDGRRRRHDGPRIPAAAVRRPAARGPGA